jgi:TonB family protein
MQTNGFPAAVLAASMLTLTGTASAQFRCDCTSVVDTCAAEVVARGSFLEVKTTEAQCARVDYFVDGQPFVSVVVDGEHRQDWLARTTNPRIMVQSCQVCRENTGAPAASAAPRPAAPAAGEDDGKLRPMIASMPEYPAAARARGTQGHVDVELTVNAEGMVENPRVTASEPRGVFDQAALAAVARWRYPAEQDRAPLTQQERVDFTLAGAGAARGAAAPAMAAAGPRNECVRQDAVYNYGDSIDVGLVNVCGEPVHVFGCAPGTGRYADRWLCNASEDQGNVLVGAADRRLGNRVTLAMPQGTRTFTYSDSFSVTRAPNAQYLWVACAEQDARCRADARQWTRSIAGQPASVDPAARSSVAIARSN